MSTAEQGPIEVGDRIPTRTFSVDRQRLVDYADAGGDQNPIHQDEDFATKVGLPNVIAHGMWTMGTAIQLVTDWIGDPTRVVSYSTRFTAPVVVPAEAGNTLEVSGTVTKVTTGTGADALEDGERFATVALEATADGAKVLGRAVAVVRLPANA